MPDFFAHWDRQGNGGEIKISRMEEITLEIAAMVIGTAGEDPRIIMSLGTLTPPCIGL